MSSGREELWYRTEAQEKRSSKPRGGGTLPLKRGLLLHSVAMSCSNSAGAQTNTLRSWSVYEYERTCRSRAGRMNERALLPVPHDTTAHPLGTSDDLLLLQRFDPSASVVHMFIHSRLASIIWPPICLNDHDLLLSLTFTMFRSLASSCLLFKPLYCKQLDVMFLINVIDFGSLKQPCHYSVTRDFVHMQSLATCAIISNLNPKSATRYTKEY
jgi:hypothetical protein